MKIIQASVVEDDGGALDCRDKYVGTITLLDEGVQYKESARANTPRAALNSAFSHCVKTVSEKLRARLDIKTEVTF